MYFFKFFGARILVLFFFILALGINISAQSLKGTIKDNASKETLIGVTVLIKENGQGVVTDIDGNFQLVPTLAPPFTLKISYIGYKAREISVTDISQKIDVGVEADNVQLKGVVVSQTRTLEKEKESALTVETMDLIAIKETPAANFYEGLGQLKGVDLTSASLGFKIINTRGFNSTRPVRSLQLIDGADNQAPGFNFSLGNFLGASELDVQKVELVAGASSALYGPNAFNGVINMTTKSPFVHKGLSIMVKGAERNMIETAIRYAGVIKNKAKEDKLGYKFNVFFMKADDWQATNYEATAQSQMPKGNWGGYDAVNIYGDENLTTGTNNFNDNYGKKNYPGLGIFYRTGYQEKDLVDYNTKNLKLNGSVHYMLTSKVEASYAYSFGTGTTVYQGDNRYSLKDIVFQQHKVEIKQNDKFFIRVYNTSEDAGHSYDAVFTAFLLQSAAKPNDRWSKDYTFYYNKYIRPKVKALPGFPSSSGPYDYSKAEAVMNTYSDSLRAWHEQTRHYADGVGNPAFGFKPFFQPGTARFDSAFNSITSKTSFTEGGSMIYDKSQLTHVQAEYKFTPKFMDVITGGSFRQYRPSSNGTLFSDTSGVKIKNYEYGLYGALEKKFFQETLKATITARLDKNQNFDYVASPAASLVYAVKSRHYFRLSFSSAIRNPTLQDQYLYYNVGRAILIGNSKGVDSLVTFNSLNNYYYALNKDTLEYFNVAPVRPEKVKSLELGYKGELLPNLFIDASYYYSWYTDFLGYKFGVATTKDIYGLINIRQFYRVSANSSTPVTTQGFSAGLNYFFWNHYGLAGNYSWNVLNTDISKDPIVPAFNTPEHKYNIGINGRDIEIKFGTFTLKNIGFNINYKWIKGFQFEGSPQFTGYVPTYEMVDAQVNYTALRIHSTFKFGISNAFDQLRYQTYGGPYIGRLIYISILFELK